MAIWRDGGFVEDVWPVIDDGAELPSDGPALISLARWRAERDSLATRAQPVGVYVTAAKDTIEHLQDAADRPLAALRFDKFGDGRAYSYAILLRERYGFAGDLRAIGDVLLDEIPLMRRCGFTSFEIVNAATLRALEEGRLPHIDLAYQPGLSPGETPAGGRPWRRRAG